MGTEILVLPKIYDLVVWLRTKPVFDAAQLGGNLFSVERSETKQVYSYDLLSQTGFGMQARNQFRCSLALAAEIGLLWKNITPKEEEICVAPFTVYC